MVDWCMLWWLESTKLVKFTTSGQDARWPKALGKSRNSNVVLSRRLRKVKKNEHHQCLNLVFQSILMFLFRIENNFALSGFVTNNTQLWTIFIPVSKKVGLLLWVWRFYLVFTIEGYPHGTWEAGTIKFRFCFLFLFWFFFSVLGFFHNLNM